MHRLNYLWLIALNLLFVLSSHAEYAVDQNTFITQMTQQGWERTALVQLLGQAEVKNSIVKAMSRPGEAKPWPQYRQLFINQARIQNGVQFWQMHAAALRNAEQQYGVPAEIIVAIIGIETSYGKITGTFRVLDALFTLSFYYPPRAAFFQKELAEFLYLTEEQNLNPLAAKGSYAGAMGIGQFMPSSYRKYAVDFDHNGQANLWQVVDSIGSVAHYLQGHGWQPGQAIVISARAAAPLSDQILASLPDEPIQAVRDFAAYGIRPQQAISENLPVYLIHLEGDTAPLYWLGLKNFYVITRYNRSWKYAMAVYELAQAIRAIPR